MNVLCQACGRSFSVEARISDAPSFVARCPGCGQPVIIRPSTGEAPAEDLPAPRGWEPPTVEAETAFDLVAPKRQPRSSDAAAAPPGRVGDLPPSAPEAAASSSAGPATVADIGEVRAPESILDLPAPKRAPGDSVVDLPAPKRPASADAPPAQEAAPAPVVARSDGNVDLPAPKRAPGDPIVDLPAPKRPSNEDLPAPKRPSNEDLPAPKRPSNQDLPAPKRPSNEDLPAPKRHGGDTALPRSPGLDLPMPKREAGGLDLPLPKREAGGLDLPLPKREAGGLDLPLPKRDAGPVDLPQYLAPGAGGRVLTPPPPGPPPVSGDLGGALPGLDELDPSLDHDELQLLPPDAGPVVFGGPPMGGAASGPPSGDVVDLPAPRGFMPGVAGHPQLHDEELSDLPAPKGAVVPGVPWGMVAPATTDDLVLLDQEDLGRAGISGDLPVGPEGGVVSDQGDAAGTDVTFDAQLDGRSVVAEAPPETATVDKPRPRLGRVLAVAGAIGLVGLGAAVGLSPDLREAVGLGGAAVRERAAKVAAARRLIAEDTPASYRKAASQLEALAEQDPRAQVAQAVAAQAHLSVVLLGATAEVKQADRALGALDPNLSSADAVAARALRALVDGRAQEAESQLVAALQQHAGDAALLTALGWTHAQAGDMAASARDFQQVVTAEPARAQALYGLGRAKEATGDDKGALDAYKKTVAVSAAHLGAALGVERLGGGPAAESEQRVQALLDKRGAQAAPRELAEAWTLLARRSAEGGRLADAEARYKKAIALLPASTEARVGLARTLCALHRPAEALQLADVAAKNEPRNLPAQLALVQAQIESRARASDVAATLAALDKLAPGAAQVSYYWGRYEELRGESGWTERAANRYREAIKADPHLIDAHMALSQALGRAGDAAGASAALQQAEQQASSDPVLRDRLGEAYLAAGNTARAETLFREAIKAAPELLLPRLHLGESLERTGRYDEAATVYEEVAAKSKDAPGLAERRGRVALALHKNQEALAFLEAALKSERSPSPTLRAVTADAMVAAGRAAEARPLYQQALLEDERNGTAHLGLSRVALAEGHPDEAERAARRAVTLTGSGAAHLSLAQAYEALGRLDLARNEFTSAARPGSPPEVVLEGRIGGVRILVRSGAVKDALVAATTLAREAPTRSEPLVLIGDCHDELGQHDAALRDYEAAVKLNPRDALAQFRYGRALADAGRQGPSAKALEEALKLGGDGASFAVEGYLLAGDVHKLLGDRAAAAAAYKKYLALAKRDAPGRKAVAAWLETAGVP